MANTELSILVTLKEQVSKDLGRLNSMLVDAQDASRRFATGLGWASAAIGGLGGLAIKTASDLEQTTISFTTMLGSAEKANIFVRDLVDFAKRTPFELRGLQDASKQLLAYGFAQNEVIPNLKALGDIAAGVGMDKLPNLILAFGQVRAATKLTGGDLRQFSEAGVPLLAQLAENFHKTAGEIQEMVSKGKIGFADVQKALMDMSKEGGRFNNLMDNQSKSLGGMISNLKDAWNQFLTQEGAKFIEWAKKVVTYVIDLVQNKLPGWIDTMARLGTALAENKVAIMLIAGAIVGALVPAIWGVIKGLAAMGSELAPFILLGAAIGLLIGIITDLWHTNEGFKNAVISAWNFISTAISDAVQAIKKAIEPVLPTLIALFDSLMQSVRAVWAVFVDLWKILEPVLKPVLEILGKVTIGILVAALNSLAFIIKGVVEVLTFLIQQFTLVVNWIRQQIEGLGALSGVWQAFGALWEAIMNKIATVREMWSGIMDGIRAATETAFEAIKSKVESVINFIQGAIDKLKSASSTASTIGWNAVGILSGGMPMAGPIGGARAGGGPVTGGVPYLVGENGPELFVPSGSGTIMANSTLGSSAGVGGGINVTITGNTISNNLDIRKLADKVGEAIVGRLRQNGRY